jgi:hypothetical protein
LLYVPVSGYNANSALLATISPAFYAIGSLSAKPALFHPFPSISLISVSNAVNLSTPIQTNIYKPITMKTVPNRIIIYTKDVVNITGKKERTARNLMSRIRAANGKSKSDLITIDEFCAFTRLKPEHVITFLK